MGKLTSRQWLLYAYLKKYCHEYKHLEEILEDKELKPLYPPANPDTPINNRTNRRQLTDDITALKNSDIVQVVIMSDSANGIKMATEEEYLQHLTKQKISLLTQLKTNYKQLEKARMNGQMRLVFNREKEVFESFVKEVANG